jgi:hypothetical protein
MAAAPSTPSIRQAPGETEGHVRRPAAQIQHRSGRREIGKSPPEQIDETLVRLGEIRFGIGAGLVFLIHQFRFGNALHGV